MQDVPRQIAALARSGGMTPRRRELHICVCLRLGWESALTARPNARGVASRKDTVSARSCSLYGGSWSEIYAMNVVKEKSPGQCGMCSGGMSPERNLRVRCVGGRRWSWLIPFGPPIMHHDSHGRTLARTFNRRRPTAMDKAQC